MASAAVCLGAIVTCPVPADATGPDVAIDGWTCVPTTADDGVTDAPDFTTCLTADKATYAVLRIAHDDGSVRQWWLDVSAIGSPIDRSDLVERATEATEALAPDDVDAVAGLSDSGSAYGPQLAYRVSGAAAAPVVDADAKFLRASMTAGLDHAPITVVSGSASVSSVSATALRVSLKEAGIDCSTGLSELTVSLTCPGLSLELSDNRLQSLEVATPAASAGLAAYATGGLAELGEVLTTLLASGESRTLVIGDLAVVVVPGDDGSVVARADL